MFAKLQRYTFVTISFFMTACSTVTVTTDYDHTASFSNYRTYTLAPSAESMTLSPTGEAALRDSLSSNLGIRGITEVSENADLHVVQHVSTKDKVVVFQSNDMNYGAMPYGYGRYGAWAGAPRTYTDVSQYTEGTLILDFVDAKTKKLVFRGTGTGTVRDTETNAERIREIVGKIVHDFPGAVTH